jgi:ketosteroid isomerase-like protein
MDVTPEAELAAIAAAWDRAMVSNDPEAIGRFMADEWLIVGSDGETTDKPTFLELVRSGRLAHDTMTTSDIHVRQYGDVCVLLATGVSAGMFQGRPFQEHERQSNVFVRTHGNWRCVLTHLSRLARGGSSSDGA